MKKYNDNVIKPVEYRKMKRTKLKKKRKRKRKKT